MKTSGLLSGRVEEDHYVAEMVLRRIVPDVPGEQPRIATGLPVNGWSRGRDTQSMAFFKVPGME